MIERAGGSGFLQEPLLTAGIAKVGTGEDLKGDFTLQPRIPGSKHFSHAARPKGGLNLVRPEACAGLQRHD